MTSTHASLGQEERAGHETERADTCGPHLRDRPNARASEVYSKYIIVDLVAKAIQGMPPEEAVKWVESELKRIYG